MDKLTKEVLDKINLVSDVLKGFQVTIRREEREVSPKDVDNRTGVNGVWGGVS